MIGTGKYDFPGLRRAGSLALKALVAGTSWGGSLLSGPFSSTINLLFEWLAEWLMNRGLILINLGAIYVEGKFDQAAFDKAMDEGLSKAKIPGLTPAQKKAIDDEIIKAFRNFARVTRAD